MIEKAARDSLERGSAHLPTEMWPDAMRPAAGVDGNACAADGSTVEHASSISNGRIDCGLRPVHDPLEAWLR